MLLGLNMPLVFAIRLGLVHRRIGQSDETAGICSMLLAQYNANTGPDSDHMVVANINRLGQFNQDPVHEVVTVINTFQVIDNDNKLITPNSGNRIMLAHSQCHSFGDLDQHGITCVMSEIVIDRLEAIQINITDGHRMVRA